MTWLQNELDVMHAAVKKRYRHSRPGDCSYCGKWIKCDMHRHVSTFHLDLGQLWCCPVSWCTVWKGTPQDCMNHVRGAHDVPSDVKSASLDCFFPPWIARHQIWADVLRPCHSGVSNDVLLFSEINISLVHHYRVFRRGLPHYTFCKDYLTRLRVFVSQASAMAQCALSSPVPASSGSPRNVLLERHDVSTPGCARLEFGTFLFVPSHQCQRRMLSGSWRELWSTTAVHEFYRSRFG